ncbi:MAG: ParA family protein [Burkholderiales bacterium]|nr:ParA family protein [Burkholderiales bacterium]
MPVIVIANPKGGVGKSTLATNVAGLLARQGHGVMLGDIDRQQSARQWLALRPPPLPRVQGWEVQGSIVRPPQGATHVVLDTPAGLQGKALEMVLAIADRLLVPLQPSLFDIQATHAFVQALRSHARAPRIAMGLVGMRVKERTQANERLQEYLATVPMPVLAWLRDTQNYVQLAAHGLSLWDVAPSRVERDLEQWQPLKEWLAR